MAVTVININDGGLNPKTRMVSRPTIYGNPFTHLPYGKGIPVCTRDEAVNQFAEYWYSEKNRLLRERAFKEFSDDDVVLGCFCIPERCHAEIIAGYLNWKRMS